jgi:drug/metabolite transporter (DMT)-like permease
VTSAKYLALGLIVVCSTLGDYFLKVGMNEVGVIRLSEPMALLNSLFNPWVALGTLLLVIFFVAFTIALSWADLSYVMPATALGYVLTTLLSSLLLGEHVGAMRWSGVVLISFAVGFVTRGRHKTRPPDTDAIAMGESH